jgi:hypothetical protein
MEWARQTASIGENRHVYKFVVGNRDGKETLGRPMRWKDNMWIIIKWDGFI